jgi:hypothetical protein
VVLFLRVAAMLLVAGAVAAAWLTRGGDDAGVPDVAIDHPLHGDSVTNPVRIVFRSAAALEAGPGGWGAGDLHIHALVNGREVMPAAADITAAGAGRWEWRLPPLQPGEQRVALQWADRLHRPAAPPADSVTFTVLR